MRETNRKQQGEGRTGRSRPQTSQLLESRSWMSRMVLLLVAPWTAAQCVPQFHAWEQTEPSVAWITLGMCALLGGLVWRLRAGTPGAAAMGAAITACLIWGTIQFPYTDWLRSALTPLLVTLALTLSATRLGRRWRKKRNSHTEIDFEEAHRGRDAAQVAANLGGAAISVTLVPFAPAVVAHNPNFAALIAYAVLAEAAADTVSSELGQAFGGTPRMITNWRRVAAGTDGAVTLEGTLAGLAAAGMVALAGIWTLTGAVRGQWLGLALILVGGVAGWVFDSLLGAVVERRGWLNNDAVNFASTVCAGAVTLELARGLAALMLWQG